MIEQSIGDLSELGYIIYGKELNSNRALPLLYDGLKPSYRKMIWKVIEAGSHIKSLDLIGRVAAIHPHGDKSIIGVENKLVRYGILKEDGNFGYYPIYGESMRPAAPRYTETGITDKWKELLAPFIDYVPKVEGEVEGVLEPKYIATPLPFSLIFGSSGVGIGINTLIPSFSPSSLLEAYLTDDPYKLKPGFDLEFVEDLCEFEDLWFTGKGRIVYSYHVEYGESGGNDGVYVSGDTQLFKPDWSTIDEWKDEGLVFVRDESTGGKYRIFIGRNKGVRKVNQDMIYEECKRCCSTEYALERIMTQYRIGIHDEKIARYISMKDWIDITYNNYIGIINSYKQSKIQDLDFETLVYTYLKPVAEILLKAKDDISNEQIAKKLKIDIEVVNAITRKSISTLKRVDTDKMLVSIAEKRDYYENLNPTEFTNSIISQM